MLIFFCFKQFLQTFLFKFATEDEQTFVLIVNSGEQPHLHPGRVQLREAKPYSEVCAPMYTPIDNAQDYGHPHSRQHLVAWVCWFLPTEERENFISF